MLKQSVQYWCQNKAFVLIFCFVGSLKRQLRATAAVSGFFFLLLFVMYTHSSLVYDICNQLDSDFRLIVFHGGGAD